LKENNSTIRSKANEESTDNQGTKADLLFRKTPNIAAVSQGNKASSLKRRVEYMYGF
jgi:hypothetical protein